MSRAKDPRNKRRTEPLLLPQGVNSMRVNSMRVDSMRVSAQVSPASVQLHSVHK